MHITPFSIPAAAAAAVSGLICAAPATAGEIHSFGFEGVLGTSLDLQVQSSSPAQAMQCQSAVLAEIQRLSSILSTRDLFSEISAVNNGMPVRSPELAELLHLYDQWSQRTGGLISAQVGRLMEVWRIAGGQGRIPDDRSIQAALGERLPLNVDALGKAYIIERSVAVARRLAPAGLLNVGGDIRAWGDTDWTIAIADPLNPAENAPHIGTTVLREGAVATSGSYARGWNIDGQRLSHILDPRTGQPAQAAMSATVITSDCVSANALATAACIGGPQAIECAAQAPQGWLIVPGSGPANRGGAIRLAEPIALVDQQPLWPKDNQVTIQLSLVQQQQQRKVKRPYLCVWVEDANGKVVRTISVWGREMKYVREMTYWWKATGGQADLVRAVSRATREPGKYSLVWDGLDDAGKPLPKAQYTIRMEVNREHGRHVQDSVKLLCGGNEKQTATIRATAESGDTIVEYGPKPKA